MERCRSSSVFRLRNSLKYSRFLPSPYFSFSTDACISDSKRSLTVLVAALEEGCGRSVVSDSDGLSFATSISVFSVDAALNLRSTPSDIEVVVGVEGEEEDEDSSASSSAASCKVQGDFCRIVMCDRDLLCHCRRYLYEVLHPPPPPQPLMNGCMLVLLKANTE